MLWLLEVAWQFQDTLSDAFQAEDCDYLQLGPIDVWVARREPVAGVALSRRKAERYKH
jgi:hypothetical protein